MPQHENDLKEIDITPPQPILTFQEWTTALQVQSKNMHRNCERTLLELDKQLNNLQEKINHLNTMCDSLEKASIKMLVALEPAEVTIQLKEENVQLKQENVQLKEEINTLKSKIHYLWELITSFFEKNISAASENWNAFFSRNKEPVSETVAPETEHSNTLN